MARELTEAEALVIQAAVDLVEDWVGAQYGPNGPQIRRSESALRMAVADLVVDWEGHWKAPS